MTTNFKPQKGKAYDKLPQNTLTMFPMTEYMVSKKYDGNQIFIVKDNNKVRFFTSDWKEFYIESIAEELLHNHNDFVLIGEFMYGCDGKLGDRPKSAILTTLRTNFNKGTRNNIDETKVNIMVFDCLMIKDGMVQPNRFYIDRVNDLYDRIHLGNCCSAIGYSLMKGPKAQDLAREFVKEGWEGAMLVVPNTVYEIGKRVNHSIKLKYRKTVDLLCVDVEEGKGKYIDMIGSLVLKDSNGRIVKVGSGLSDYERNLGNDIFIGKVVEIEYEQLMATYIQPTYVGIRNDKTAKDID